MDVYSLKKYAVLQRKKIHTALFIIADYIAASGAWALFFIYRKLVIEPAKFGYSVPLIPDQNFYIGILLIPLLWVLVYAFSGAYRDVYRKSRLKELGQTLYMSLIGVLIIFFALLLDDEVQSYKTYYKTFLTLFLLQFFLTSLFRFTLSSWVVRMLHRGQIGFNTLLVGSKQNALNLLHEIERQHRGQGNRFLGFVSMDNDAGNILAEQLPHLGYFHDLRRLIHEQQIEEVIIAIESSEHDKIKKILNELDEGSVVVKVLPDMYDILSGSVKMTAIFGAPLIEISPSLMPPWQQSVKRIFDLLISLFVLVFFSPVFLFTALCVKCTSRGPAIYKQSRIGLHGKPFTIYKFRSMYVDAEKSGPMLSSQNDNRLTPFGRFMRKVRLDEIPQFFNVLFGDMSLVGPRPERQFFIDQIAKIAPHYHHLHKVRPGITSWGQVKFGYAESVEQMVERLKYDLIYIENMSLAVDMKILIYTVLIVLQGRGK